MLDPNVKQSLFVEQPRRISAWYQDEYRSVPFSVSQVLICSTAQEKMHHEIHFIEKSQLIKPEPSFCSCLREKPVTLMSGEMQCICVIPGKKTYHD